MATTVTTYQTRNGALAMDAWDHDIKIFNEKYHDAGAPFLACIVCARDTSKKGNSQGVYIGEGGGTFIAVADVLKEENDGGFMGWFPIGSECIKKVPVEFRAPNPYDDKVRGI